MFQAHSPQRADYRHVIMTFLFCFEVDKQTEHTKEHHLSYYLAKYNAKYNVKHVAEGRARWFVSMALALVCSRCLQYFVFLHGRARWLVDCARSVAFALVYSRWLHYLVFPTRGIAQHIPPNNGSIAHLKVFSGGIGRPRYERPSCSLGYGRDKVGAMPYIVAARSCCHMCTSR